MNIHAQIESVVPRASGTGAAACITGASFSAPRHVVDSAWLEHGPFAFWITEALRPQVMVELGTHNGYSFMAFCQAVRQLGLQTSCHAVDTWEGDKHAGFYGHEVHDRLAAHNEAHYGAFARLLRCRFDQALAHIADGTIDLLHIDGRHTYDDVREDFESWLPKLSPRAVVLFHDTNERTGDFGVWRYWAELRLRYPAFEFLHGHGLGVLGPEVPAGVQALFDAGSGQTDVIRTAYAHLGLAISRQHMLETQAKALAERTQALEQSISWRVTKPVRRLFARLPEGLRRTLHRGAKLLWWAATPHRLPARIATLRARRLGEAQAIASR